MASARPSIAGYELQQRLGEGGYGEVWKAIAPGGFVKAVKILHGRFDGPKAESELKSLERMRELRHPFLLSLERIEICDQRMIIVTELAEGSLDDVFQRYRQAGKPGIPRDELLGYLRDSADALDYIFDAHGLQHLDIKPGNILIQGGHGKVADFGMVKDVRQSQVSVGGFTPLFAPPELLEGRPGRNSDQYSLGMVYQMMLTGVSPFSGRTAAQLASQHLSSAPDLSSLPGTDRGTIGRALAKNPGARFRCCRDLIEALNAKSERTNVAVGRHTNATPVTPAGSTRPGSSACVSPAAKIPSRPILATKDLPALMLRPQLVIGIGGLAGEVITAYRQKLSARFNHYSRIPLLSTLTIDCDPHAIASQRAQQARQGIESDEFFSMPLHEPLTYRERSADLGSWLKRHWLFNIPRSQRTEGLRPLGRLAWTSAEADLKKRLTQLAKESLSASAVRQTVEVTGLEWTGVPEVVILASTTGGTGASAMFDIAYQVRQVFTELKMPLQICGVMLHGTATKDATRDRQVASTLACLREWNHFVDHGYTPSGGSQISADPRPPFEHAYLVHLGDGLNDQQATQRGEAVAEYLLRTATTPLRRFVDLARMPTDHDALSTGTGLRTLQLAAASESTDLPSQSAQRLCLALIDAWSDEHTVKQPGESPEFDHAAWVNQLLADLKLDLKSVSSMAHGVLRSDIGKRFFAFVARRLKELGSRVVDPVLWESVVTADFQPQDGDDNLEQPGPILQAVSRQLAQWSQNLAETIRTRILASPIDGGPGLSRARDALAEVVQQLTVLSDGLDAIVVSPDVNGPAIDPMAAETAAARLAASRDLVQQVYAQRFWVGLIAALSEATREMALSIKGCGGDVTNLRLRLSQVATALAEPRRRATATDPQSNESRSPSGAAQPPKSTIPTSTPGMPATGSENGRPAGAVHGGSGGNSGDSGKPGPAAAVQTPNTPSSGTDRPQIGPADSTGPDSESAEGRSITESGQAATAGSSSTESTPSDPVTDPAVVREFERWLQAERRATPRGLSQLPLDALPAWLSWLHQAAGRYLEDRQLEPELSPTHRMSNGHRLLPVLWDVGGRHRVAVTTTRGKVDGSTKARLEAVFGRCLVELVDPNSRSCELCEVEGLDLDAVMQRLAEKSPQANLASTQLLTRRDLFR